MDKTLVISYQEYDLVDQLSVSDQSLMQRAIKALDSAYAPYSHFQVGCALRLGNGAIITGSNQENVAYPSGLCAERTAMFAASSQYPTERQFDAMALVGRNTEGQLCEASPCGACRQVMAEYELQQGYKMRVLCWLSGGRVRVVEGVENWLPFAFIF